MVERAESAAGLIEEGFVSLRTTPFFPASERDSSTRLVKTAVEIVRSIREAVGDEIDLGVFDTFQIPYSCLAPRHHEHYAVCAVEF